jgi:oligopeptide/dipeptide ABC transporter ATP-binding protein
VTERRDLLSVRDLSVSFATDGGILRALDRVSFDVPAGRTVALVGESGCGKSVTAQAILRLIPTPPGKIDNGQIFFEDRDLLALTEREMRPIRGGRIGMVFQEPMTSLNPVYTIGAQIMEAIRLHRDDSRGEAKKRAIELLRKVGFPDPETRFRSYPHELSGGMRQRAIIAMAIACDPALLIADEPTTALDMMTQAQILALLQDLQRDRSMSLLLIAHDLGVVAELADEIVVLYAGVVVERGPTRSILQAPSHPYTQALLKSVPPAGKSAYRPRGKRARRLPTIAGVIPDLRAPPSGCRFSDRCEHAWFRCQAEEPQLYSVEHGGGLGKSVSRCFLCDPAEKNRGSNESKKEREDKTIQAQPEGRGAASESAEGAVSERPDTRRSPGGNA